MSEFIEKIKRSQDLTQEEIGILMQDIMTAKMSEKDMGEFLVALNEKGPTVDEITGSAKILRNFCLPVKTKHKRILDTCGTGGDKKDTFNISTAVALVVAACGVPVAKHGNRAVSSKCGSACVLEALGVNIQKEPDELGRSLDQIGIAFLFAQRLHPAMKNVANVRRSLGVRTIFNIIGPLINPASATHQLMGIYAHKFVEPMARVLMNLGLKRAMVVHGEDGLDEITITGNTFVSEYDGQEISTYEIFPRKFGVKPCDPEAIKGGTKEQSVQIIREILDGKGGPPKDIVAFNAAFALFVADKVKNVSDGFEMAIDAINTGKAKTKLEALVNFSNNKM